MPWVKVEKVDVEIGRQVWRASVKWNPDLKLVAHGESLSKAFRLLAKQAEDEETKWQKKEDED